MTAQEMLSTTNLDWNVRKENLVTQSGIIIPDKVAMVREDTNTILGIHGTNYEVYQNLELMELLHKISSSTGLAIHKSGEFGDGKKVFIQLKSDDMIFMGDKIEGYITGCSSHDGSTSLGFGTSTLTISCMNTFYRAMRELDTKLKHTTSMRPRLDQILFGIDKLLLEEKNTFTELKRLSEIEVTQVHKDLVTKLFFQLENTDKLGDLSTRMKNQIDVFEMDVLRELNDKGNTLYGLMNGLTRYTTHDKYKTLEKGMENKMFSKTGVLERSVYNKLLTFA
jgi:hypothetical protein